MRANPRMTLQAILNAGDRAQAEDRLTAALRRTWAAGHGAGWRDGVLDANGNGDTPVSKNPYSKRDAT